VIRAANIKAEIGRHRRGPTFHNLPFGKWRAMTAYGTKQDISMALSNVCHRG